MKERHRNELGGGTQAVQHLRDATSDICDVTPLCSADEFRFSSAVIAVGSGVLVESNPAALRYDRTPRHIARSGMDDYHVTLCLSDIEFSSGRRNISMRPGDVFLVDMTEANSTIFSGQNQKGRSPILALILPRVLLAPLLATPDSAAASLLSRDTPQGNVVAEELFAISRRSELLTPEEGAAAASRFAALVADGIGKRSEAEALTRRAKGQALLSSIKRHIDANLETETVTVEKLCGRFQLSRATLYRLFEPEGGLSRYIQDQKLNRAFKRLISPAFRETRMTDFAVDFHFSSDSTFVRAFRRQFGLTPGEVRQLTHLRTRDQAGNGTGDPNDVLPPWYLR